MSLDAHLLAASPHMNDANFAHSVVLLIQHSDEGAFGVVLNKPSEHRVSEVWEEVGEGGVCELDEPLRLGGPVEGPLMAVHDDAELSDREIMPGVHFASQRSALKQLIEHPTGPVRLFTGYSGWASGQLEEELRVGAWLATVATPDFIFFEGDDLWRRVVSQIGGEILHSRGDIKHVPPAPWMN